MHLTFGIPYAGTSLFWAVVLGVVFFLWDRSEHTLSIHSITTSRREKFYWATIFARSPSAPLSVTSPPQTLGLGYLPLAIFFCVVILIPWVGWGRSRMNEIFAFWFAYVVTRPIGASFADYFSKPKDTQWSGSGATSIGRRPPLPGRLSLSPIRAIARFDIQSSGPAPDSDTDPAAGAEFAGGT